MTFQLLRFISLVFSKVAFFYSISSNVTWILFPLITLLWKFLPCVTDHFLPIPTALYAPLFLTLLCVNVKTQSFKLSLPLGIRLASNFSWIFFNVYIDFSSFKSYVDGEHIVLASYVAVVYMKVSIVFRLVIIEFLLTFCCWGNNGVRLLLSKIEA